MQPPRPRDWWPTPVMSATRRDRKTASCGAVDQFLGSIEIQFGWSPAWIHEMCLSINYCKISS